MLFHFLSWPAAIKMQLDTQSPLVILCCPNLKELEMIVRNLLQRQTVKICKL